MDDFRRACRTGQLTHIQKVAETRPDWLNHQEPHLWWTPLFQSVISEQFQAAQLLLGLGASPNLQTKLGETPLHQACAHNNSAMVKLLLTHGADPHIQQNDGDTPLHYACTQSATEVAQLLLSQGADACLPNKVFDQTPTDLARAGGFLDLVSLLEGSASFHFKSASPTTMPTEEDPLWEWLYQHKLESTYETLYENGFEDFYTLASAVRDQVLTLEVLSRLGVRPAHRRLLLLAFQPKPRKAVSEYGITLRPSLCSWLAAMHLPQLLEQFTEAGFEDLDQVVAVMQSPYALTEAVLETELRIEKLGHRLRVMMKLNQLVCEDRRSESYAACSSCGIF